MPFAGFKDWDDAISKLKQKGYSEESAKKIAGHLKAKFERGDNMDGDLNKEKMVDKISKLDLAGIPRKMSIGGPVTISRDGKVNPSDTVTDKK